MKENGHCLVLEVLVQIRGESIIFIQRKKGVGARKFMKPQNDSLLYKYSLNRR